MLPPSVQDGDNVSRVETTDHIDDTIKSSILDVRSPENDGVTDKSQKLALSEDNVRDSDGSQSHIDLSESTEQRADSKSGNESSTDELDVPAEGELEPRTTISKQRVVTFEDMSKHHTYRGPLITSEQLIDAGEDLTKIIFCRHFTSSVKKGGPEQERGYGEMTVAGLTQGLKHAQELYNQQDVLSLDLVFFEKFIRHAARLSRLLVSIDLGVMHTYS